MARRCLCSRLLAAVEGEPRLRTLPLAARMLFLLVAENAARSPEPGLLPYASPARVSLLVSASETEVETQLETLLSEGLLRAERGGLAVPLLLEAASRAEVARRNGAAGGRPRKGETKEAARDRRQGEMALPLAGGKPTETQAVKPDHPATTSHSGSSSLEGTQSSARETPAHVVLGHRIAEIARLDGARGGFDFRPVQAWLKAGIAEDTILGAIAAAAARPNFDGCRVHSLKYFDRVVEAEHARAAPARSLRVVDTPEDEARLRAIQARIEAARYGHSEAAA